MDLKRFDRNVTKPLISLQVVTGGSAGQRTLIRNQLSDFNCAFFIPDFSELRLPRI